MARNPVCFAADSGMPEVPVRVRDDRLQALPLASHSRKLEHLPRASVTEGHVLEGERPLASAPLFPELGQAVREKRA